MPLCEPLSRRLHLVWTKFNRWYHPTQFTNWIKEPFSICIYLSNCSKVSEKVKKCQKNIPLSFFHSFIVVTCISLVCLYLFLHTNRLFPGCFLIHHYFHVSYTSTSTSVTPCPCHNCLRITGFVFSSSFFSVTSLSFPSCHISFFFLSLSSHCSFLFLIFILFIIFFFFYFILFFFFLFSTYNVPSKLCHWCTFWT